MFPERLIELRTSKDLTHQQMADMLGITRQAYGNYEAGKREPDHDTMKRLAEFFNVSTDFLLGLNFSDKLLTPKEEKDIAKDLEKMLSNLESDEGLAFMGEPMDDETKELMRISLENSMRLAKQLAKQKFTPKKHK
ncbi:putative transcriptional regulator [Desulfitobacterium dehalogenans ATCC 51507]|uniref:Putative transcriptional regulator n=1 Tax=Desulfitobacterium dehalogenans (strain ATCC 51507 / DSM 9161 / JW/IU-DC1) TaxID=756499 RepID=I4A689_DESDJ|nr:MULTISPECIES: helix-turn-helix transcriptional regulator [Desulfitobacterium]AFL99473.1 putative transcriptional regulator [Desulfitobacterium dehalogenans ATCC 51507]